MNKHVINVLSPRASDITRRGSLAVLGSTGLAAVASSPRAVAKKPSKKAKRRARKNGKKKCKKQLDQCTAVFADLCAGEEDPPACEAQTIPCCPLFAHCHVDDFINCVFSVA